jgi:hypothetical protein
VSVSYPRIKNVGGHDLAQSVEVTLVELKNDQSVGTVTRARRGTHQRSMDNRALTMQTIQLGPPGELYDVDAYLALWDTLWPHPQLKFCPRDIFAKNFVGRYQMPAQSTKQHRSAPTTVSGGPPTAKGNDGWVEVPLDPFLQQDDSQSNIPSPAPLSPSPTKPADQNTAVAMPKVKIDVKSEDEDYYGNT